MVTVYQRRCAPKTNVIGMKYLKELPAIVRDARATFQGLNEADIITAINEMNAGKATLFQRPNTMTRLSRKLKML